MDFILSDGKNKNTKGYRVAIGGIRLERFKKNPVMLYGHDPDKVIGRWENIRVENEKLMATAVFDNEDPLGKEVARKVKDNFLRTASMGISPLKLEHVDDEFVLAESELMEASIVAIPSDAGAVKLYSEKLEELSFDQVKINFNFNNNTQKTKQMAGEIFKLSHKTMESLDLGSDFTAKDVELAVAEKDRKIEKLEADLKAVEKQAQTDYLSNAVKAGKISEAERVSFQKLCDKGCFEDVKTMIDAKVESASETLADKVQKTNLTAGREDWNYLKWMKEDSAGLEKIRVEHPKEFERLQQTLKK